MPNLKTKPSKTKQKISKFTGLPISLIAILLFPALIFSSTTKPGTEIFGISMGYKTDKEISEIVNQKIAKFHETPHIFTIQNQKFQLRADEMGIQIDPNVIMAQIPHVKESGFADIFMNSRPDVKIEHKATLNTDTIFQKAQSIIGTQTVREAGLTLNEKGEISIIEGQAGLVIDKKKLVTDLEFKAETLSLTPIQIHTKIQNPPVMASEIEQNIDRVKKQLIEEKIIKFGETVFKIRLLDHLDWISFEKDIKFNGLKGKESLKIALDFEKTKAWINETLSPGIDIEPKAVKIYEDENSNIRFEGTAEDGRAIQKTQLVRMLELSLNEEIQEFDIPIKTLKGEAKISDSLKAIGIRELIGIGHTTFYGSTQNRVHNIQTGIAKYNGLVIAPGETFSFNANLGAVDAITGFLPELTIKPEGTIKEYGGGLCQVSTTLYRAALMSGLPITERSPHSYAVSYYSQLLGYGLDATIYPGSRDVRFLNDTPGHIVMQSYTEGMHAYYKFYGTSDGRKVSLEGPYISNYTSPPDEPVIIEVMDLPPGEKKQTESAHTGFDARWYRHLKRANGEIVKEEIFTRYQAVPEKIMVGKEDESSISESG